MIPQQPAPTLQPGFDYIHKFETGSISTSKASTGASGTQTRPTEAASMRGYARARVRKRGSGDKLAKECQEFSGRSHGLHSLRTSTGSGHDDRRKGSGPDDR